MRRKLRMVIEQSDAWPHPSLCAVNSLCAEAGRLGSTGHRASYYWSSTLCVCVCVSIRALCLFAEGKAQTFCCSYGKSFTIIDNAAQSKQGQAAAFALLLWFPCVLGEPSARLALINYLSYLEVSGVSKDLLGPAAEGSAQWETWRAERDKQRGDTRGKERCMGRDKAVWVWRGFSEKFGTKEMWACCVCEGGVHSTHFAGRWRYRQYAATSLEKKSSITEKTHKRSFSQFFHPTLFCISQSQHKTFFAN